MQTIISLGDWIRRRRRALDLTQSVLAERVGCVVGTIKSIESDLRRPSRQMAERLAMVLELADDRRDLFLKAARSDIGVDQLPDPRGVSARGSEASIHPPPTPHRGPLRHNLPAPTTSLHGRADAVREVVGMLRRADVRLLTLTGPGGIGKTRLAIQVGLELLPCFADGVWFVDLAPIDDSDLVTARIGQALGLADLGDGPAGDRLVAALRERQLLLILDNVERLVAAAGQIAALIRAPGITILATSRGALHLRAEREYAVETLALPPPEQSVSPETAAKYAAVALFVDRAQAIRSDFRLTAANTMTVSAICRRLDGLPLAIELAAARMNVLTPPQILARLHRRLGLLGSGPHDAPARQRTMRAAIDWSYQLLDQHVQRLFRHLGVFVGGWSVEMAESIWESVGDPAVPALDGLTALLDNSMARRLDGPDDESRFVMLETIREYALDQLEAAGEVEQARRLHAMTYLRMVETAGLHLRGASQAIWLGRLEREHDNIRAALWWSFTAGDSDVVLGIVGAIWPFWLAARSQPLDHTAELEPPVHGMVDVVDSVHRERMGLKDLFTRCLIGLAGFVASHNPDYAVRLLGAAAALQAVLGLTLGPDERAVSDGITDHVRLRMSADDFAAAWAAGRELGANHAVALEREPWDVRQLPPHVG